MTHADRIPLTRPVPTRTDRLNDARGCDVEVERDQLRAELGRALDALATIRDGQERIDRALAAYDTTPESTPTPALGSPADRAQDEPAAWIVPKVAHDQNRLVGPRIHGRWIHRAAGQSDPEHARRYAAELLAAADEAEKAEG